LPRLATTRRGNFVSGRDGLIFGGKGLCAGAARVLSFLSCAIIILSGRIRRPIPSSDW